MACPPPDNLRYFKEDDDVVDLVGVHPFKPIKRSQPTSKKELIDAVAESSKVKRELRALGSAWSLSRAAEAADIIDTLYLCKHLSPPHGGRASLDEIRLADDWDTNVLGMFCVHHSSEVGRRKFVHVEGGIKIKQLLCDLKSCGLALPTMGAGGGQSLVGALSTGTHGADFMVPPLVEWVRALHLIGPLGKEWWITPADGIFTGAEVLQLPGWPAWGEIFANDDAFNAARVAVGRMGVIYSLILEVVEAYTLLEITHQGVDRAGFLSNRVQPVQTVSYPGQRFVDQGGKSKGQVFTNTGLDKNSWPTVKKQLSNSGVVDGQPFGIFDTPVTDFDSGWLRQEVIEPTVAAIIEAFKSKASAARESYPQSVFISLAIDPTALALAEEFNTDLTSEQREQLDDALALPISVGSSVVRVTFEFLGLMDFVVQKMGLEQLAAGLRGSSVKPLRHLGIVMSLATPDVCWITRRWALTGVTAIANLGRPEPNEVETALRQPDKPPGTEGTDPMPVLTLISKQILDAVQRGIDREANSYLGVNFVFPAVKGIGVNTILRPIAAVINREVPRINQAVTAAKGTSGEALFLFLYRLATDPDPAVRKYVRPGILSSVTGVIGGNAYVNPVRAGESNDILDIHSYSLDYTACGDSAEYLFDAVGHGYLAFANAVVELSRTPIAPGFWATLAGSGQPFGPRGEDPPPILGYMGIRFTPRASALIAMQRYELTASVEVAVARTRTEPDLYAKFWAAVHEAARANGGIPHWGQEFILSADNVSTHYGEDLMRWQQILTELSVDDPHVFSTAFTRDLGLEPSGTAGVLLYDVLTAFLTALEGASDS